MFGGYVNIELTPDLLAGNPTIQVLDELFNVVDPTPANVSYDHNTGRFEIGFSDTNQVFTMTLPVTVADGAALNEQCLTAEVIAMPPAGPAPLDDPSDNSAKVCLGGPTIPLQSGEVSAFTLYPCVGITTDPCDSDDDVRVRATAPDQDGYIIDPGAVVFHVQDHPLARAFDAHNGSVNSGDVVSWQTSCHGGTASCTGYHDTRTEFGVKLGWNRIPFNGHWRRAGPPATGSWDGISLNVAARGEGEGTDPPGTMHLRATGSRNALYPLTESNGWSHTWRGDNPWKPSGDTTSITYQFAEFEELGTYVVDYTLRAKHFSQTGDCDTEIDADTNPDSFCDTETYIFHIGPMADLSVADGGVSPDVATDQYAITIAALNDGQDYAVGAEVDINLSLPAGVTVADHIASDGAYSNSKWDLGALPTDAHLRDYQRSLGEPAEGATLTLILEGENAADATATATIAHDNENHPYQVCIGSDRSNLAHTTRATCVADTTNGGSWHEGTVYDHNADNNTATITAARGTGGVGPGAPAAGSPPSTAPAAIVVEWQPVPTVNGWTVSHYEIERSSSEWEDLEDNVACPADADTCQFVDTTAQAGQYYGYRVRAVNAPGVPGPWSRPMEIGRILTVGAPEAPALTATPNEPDGDTQIRLTWNKPVENGSAIESYTVEVAERSNGPWAAPTNPPPALGPDATSWVHAGLPDGTTRYYRIKATNAQGDGPWSNVVEAKTRLADLPAPPENVRAAADGGNAIDVSWDEPKLPDDHEGWNITRYEVERSADGVSGWRGAGSVDGETLTFKDGSLRPGDTRHYRVAARNSRGRSDWSYPPYATATTPAGVPGQPTLRAQAVAHDSINLTWTKPADNGSDITQYDIQWSEDGKSGSWQDLAGVSPANITSHVDSGLDPVTTRHYRVRAVNGAGAGTWSRAASATTTVDTTRGLGPPSAPLNLVALAGDRSIEAVWDPPARDGGSPITGYEVWLDGSKVSDDSANTYLSIFEDSKGNLLTNGRRYYVRVRAINESGRSGPWASASAVPTKPQVPPGEPRNVEQTGGHGHIVVTWREPYGLGHPELTGYRVQYREDCSGDNCTDWLPARPISALPTDRSATITGLDNGTTYQVLVWAVNRAGDSPKAGADGALKATPQQAGDGQGHPPTNPRNLRLSPGVGQITVSWSAPSDRGEPAFAGYQVEYRCRWCSYDEWGTWTTLTFGDDESTSTTSTRATITGLDPEVDYQVQVKTVDNGYGSGLIIAQTTTR